VLVLGCPLEYLHDHFRLPHVYFLARFPAAIMSLHGLSPPIQL
jgi:hypothetical protein